jgi:hypothetical protein
MTAGNTDQALAYLESARELDPDYPTLYLRLGKLQLGRSDLTAARMAPPSERAVMQAELDAYEQGELPEPVWPEGDPLFSTPPFDPVAPFRDYPVSVPY